MTKETALKLQKGMNKVTSGTFHPHVIHCDEDGSLEVTWLDGTTTTEEFFAWDDRDATEVKSVTVVSGTFSFNEC